MQVIPVDREVAEVARASGRPLTLVGVDSLRESELRCSLGICVCVLISVWKNNNTIRVYLFLKRYYNKSKQKTNSVEYLSTNERELDIISCRHSGRRQLLPCACPHLSEIINGTGRHHVVTSAGWQVTPCDPIWHVSSSSGMATLVSELLYSCYSEDTGQV